MAKSCAYDNDDGGYSYNIMVYDDDDEYMPQPACVGRVVALRVYMFLFMSTLSSYLLRYTDGRSIATETRPYSLACSGYCHSHGHELYRRASGQKKYV